ncbi:MAG: DUF2750 domain-containing protein [Prevotella pallens]|jgi:hypothetical protein|uniref:Protein of uncharacterized function (DUF2750) n=1 Tax=Prevotella pallens TaxID=60133 RepID=A0A379F333_9BACT|nr:DUF2750 domain-containing protein [Prevotella pallens]MBF1488170.1 DUF2750 domain-containing protein [Prevotella pallens]SUC13059.1 Protein of uncharacterised function (DUF2750) [Prevotella pallens]
MKVSKQELEAVIALSPEKRYNYFVKRICDWEQVWTLYEDDYIVLNEAKNGKLYILLFPFKDFAEHYATNTRGMKGVSYKSFEINEFLETIIKKLQANNVSNALVFPVANGYGLNVSMTDMVKDIQSELENYK